MQLNIGMRRYNAKNFLFSSGLLILLFIMVLVTACAPITKKDNTVNPIADAKSIGKALGCLFGGCGSKADQDKTQPASK